MLTCTEREWIANMHEDSFWWRCVVWSESALWWQPLHLWSQLNTVILNCWNFARSDCRRRISLQHFNGKHLQLRTLCAIHTQEICLSYLPPSCVFHRWIITCMNHNWHVNWGRGGGGGLVRKESRSACRRLHSCCINLIKSIPHSRAWGVPHCICNCSPRYSNEGRVTNITLPTGEVSGFHSNLERWSRVEVEASTRENFVTSTNLSAGDTIYTFKQGETLWWHAGKEDVRVYGKWYQVLHMHILTHLCFHERGTIALAAWTDVHPP